jgi:hypothetical protein
LVDYNTESEASYSPIVTQQTQYKAFMERKKTQSQATPVGETGTQMPIETAKKNRGRPSTKNGTPVTPLEPTKIDKVKAAKPTTNKKSTTKKTITKPTTASKPDKPTTGKKKDDKQDKQKTNDSTKSKTKLTKAKNDQEVSDECETLDRDVASSSKKNNHPKHKSDKSPIDDGDM